MANKKTSKKKRLKDRKKQEQVLQYFKDKLGGNKYA